MVRHLLVIAGPDEGRRFKLAEDQTLLIGRGPNTQTQLKDQYVSRVHCVVQVAGDKVTLTDSGSSTGTRVNGQPVTEHELKAGDVIQLGSTQLVFQCQEEKKGFSTIGLDLSNEPTP
jgi:pSer/pThr/pTyr-binding forkhead associated (FHA) protein